MALSRREKVICALALTSLVAYAGYWGFGRNGPSKSGQGTPSLSTTPSDHGFSTLLMGKIVKKRLSPTFHRVRCLTDHAGQIGPPHPSCGEIPLPRSTPLFAAPPEILEPGTPEGPIPRYSGYLQSADHPVAFLDGKAYRLGEAVSGWEVVDIAPSHVRLKDGAHEIRVSRTLLVPDTGSSHGTPEPADTMKRNTP